MKIFYLKHNLQICVNGAKFPKSDLNPIDLKKRSRHLPEISKLCLKKNIVILSFCKLYGNYCIKTSSELG